MSFICWGWHPLYCSQWNFVNRPLVDFKHCCVTLSYQANLCASLFITVASFEHSWCIYRRFGSNEKIWHYQLFAMSNSSFDPGYCNEDYSFAEFGSFALGFYLRQLVPLGSWSASIGPNFHCCVRWDLHFDFYCSQQTPAYFVAINIARYSSMADLAVLGTC